MLKVVWGSCVKTVATLTYRMDPKCLGKTEATRWVRKQACWMEVVSISCQRLAESHHSRPLMMMMPCCYASEVCGSRPHCLSDGLSANTSGSSSGNRRSYGRSTIRPRDHRYHRTTPPGTGRSESTYSIYTLQTDPHSVWVTATVI